jgi:hypothetical protein
MIGRLGALVATLAIGVQVSRAAPPGAGQHFDCTDGGTSSCASGDTGCVPDTVDHLKCGDGIAKAIAKAVVAVVKCHQKQASNAFKGDWRDDETCEVGPGGHGAREKLDDALEKLEPSCSAEQLAAAAALEASLFADPSDPLSLDALNASVYCDSTSGSLVDLTGDDVGFVPNSKSEFLCADQVAKAIAKLWAGVSKCQSKMADAFFSGAEFDESLCEQSGGKSALDKYVATMSKLDGKGICTQTCMARAARDAIGAAVLARIEAANAAAFPCAGPPTTTTTSVTSTTVTTTTVPADCPAAEAAGMITLPTDLPKQALCIDNPKPGTPANPDCKGWLVVGKNKKKFEGLQELAIALRPALLYEWKSPDKKTVCLYLFRGAGVVTANGVLCFNKDTCDVCAYDADGAPPLWANLKAAKTDSIQNCSACHSAGTIAPKEKFLEQVEGTLKSLNDKCAELGGPRWIGAPTSWAARDAAEAPAGRHVKTPKKSECARCHEDGFIKNLTYCVGGDGNLLATRCTTNADCTGGLVCGNPFCDYIVTPTFSAGLARDGWNRGGAMKGYTFKDQAQCQAFANDMGCTTTQFDCASSPP